MWKAPAGAAALASHLSSPKPCAAAAQAYTAAEGETEWLLDEREPGASWAGAGSCLGCVPLDVSHRPLAEWGF